jgi:hypothetical protein
MSDIPDKPPVKHEHIVKRSNTISGLVDDIMRGIKPADRPISVAGLTQSGGPWEKLYKTAAESLHQRSHLNPVPENQVQADVMSRQLEALNSLTPEKRKTLIGDLSANEKHFAELEACSNKVSEAMRAGYMPAVLEQQYLVIKGADALNQNALGFELRSIEEVRAKEKDETKKSILDRAVEDARTAMAAPFIERARLSAFLTNQTRVYQSEKTLAEALKLSIPTEALTSSFVADLKKNAAAQLSRLRIENHLLEQFDSNLARFELQAKDGAITQEELEAARIRGGDDNFRALTDFLSDNYKYLTGKHWSLFGKDGITRSDIIEYQKERDKKINDLKI